METLISVEDFYAEILAELPNGTNISQEAYVIYCYNAIRDMNDKAVFEIKEIEFKEYIEKGIYNSFKIPKNAKVLEIKTEAGKILNRTNDYNNITYFSYYRNGTEILVNRNINQLNYIIETIVLSENGYPMIRDSAIYKEYMVNYILNKQLKTTESKQDYLWSKAKLDEYIKHEAFKLDDPFSKINAYYGNKR